MATRRIERWIPLPRLCEDVCPYGQGFCGSHSGFDEDGEKPVKREGFIRRVSFAEILESFCARFSRSSFLATPPVNAISVESPGRMNWAGFGVVATANLRGSGGFEQPLLSIHENPPVSFSTPCPRPSSILVCFKRHCFRGSGTAPTQGQ